MCYGKLPINYFVNTFPAIGFLKRKVANLATREIVENSHLATLDDDTIDEMVEKISPNVKYDRNSITVSLGEISRDDPALKLDESKTFETFSTLLLKKSRNMDIITFLERMAVLQNKFNLSDVQIDFLLTEYNIKFFSNSDEVVKLNSAVKSNFPLFRALYEIERQRERDTVSTRENTFREIDKNRYLEIRDNQRFLLEIGENGEIVEEELKYGNNTIFRGRDRLEINYTNGMEDVEIIINGKKKRPGIPTSFREIKDTTLGYSIIKIVEEKVEANEYLEILDDALNPYRFKGIRYTGEVDTRSRKINFEKLIKDLQSIQKGIPESIRQDLFNEMLFSLLDKTYGTNLKKNDDVADLYFEIRDNFELMFDKNINNDAKKRFLERITDSAEQLNRIRIERVEESAKTAAISFETPEAQKEYFKHLNQEKKKAEIEDNQMLQSKLTNFNYNNYIEYEERTTEEIPYSLSGIYTTDDIDTRERKIKIADFADSLTEFLKDIPEDKKEHFFETIFDKMMERAYRISKKNLENDKDLNRATLNIKTALNLNVFGKVEIDEESLSGDFELLNKFHKELAESNKAHSMIGFKDENTRKMFEVISKIVETGATEGEMGTQLRSLIEIHNDMIKNRDSKTDSREQ